MAYGARSSNTAFTKGFASSYPEHGRLEDIYCVNSDIRSSGVKNEIKNQKK